MPLSLVEATYDDMPGLVDCFFSGYSEPYHAFVDLLCPGAGHNRLEGKPHASKLFLSKWKSDPCKRWIKVIDPGKDELIIGFSRWCLYDKNPFPNGPPHVEATWYPEGSLERKYLTYLMNDRLQRQAGRCSKPHVWLGTMTVRPAYRRLGAASTMMQWGVDRATEMKVPIFVEASWHGLQVYRRFGFEYVEKINVRRPQGMERDADWESMEAKYPFDNVWLVRP